MAIEVVRPDVPIDQAEFFYAQVLNKSLHPIIKRLLWMTNAEFARKYCEIHKDACESTLLKMMNNEAKYYRWAGADLMRARDVDGNEKMVVIEMNSCPSGNKSVPNVDWGVEGFERVIGRAFVPLLKDTQSIVPGGGLAVFYDVCKQRRESFAYATVLARLTGEEVFLVDVGYANELPDFLKWSSDGVCHLEVKPGEWRDIRAVFRYVTRRPWIKLPLLSKTVVLNPVVACLAGGRNKLLAAKAYTFFNEKYGKSDGLFINTPMTIPDVTKHDIPKHAKRMNYQLVVKVPYSNCGVGVYTITSERELNEFMAVAHVYDKFIVQGLVSHSAWPYGDVQNQLHHVGCRPRSDPDNLYVNDLRFMVCSGPGGWRPVALYSRRSAAPLNAECPYPSWEMLGTNLSMGVDGTSGTDTSRLLLLDDDTYPDLNLGSDELVESYVQTVLAATAVEDLCQKLMHSTPLDIPQGIEPSFDLALFKKLDEDNALLAEIASGCAQTARLFPELKALTLSKKVSPCQSPCKMMSARKSNADQSDDRGLQTCERKDAPSA